MKFNLKPPCIIFETDKFIGENFDGKAFGPLVFVRPGSSEHLLVHELTHVKQFYKTFFLLPILYSFKKFKLKYELEAHRAQFKAGGSARGLAISLSTKYGLNISEEEAYIMITREEFSTKI